MNSKVFKAWSGLVILAVWWCTSTLILVGMAGCRSGPPHGTLQVFYTGNLSGNLEPCG